MSKKGIFVKFSGLLIPQVQDVKVTASVSKNGQPSIKTSFQKRNGGYVYQIQLLSPSSEVLMNKTLITRRTMVIKGPQKPMEYVFENDERMPNVLKNGSSYFVEVFEMMGLSKGPVTRKLVYLRKICFKRFR